MTCFAFDLGSCMQFRVHRRLAHPCRFIIVLLVVVWVHGRLLMHRYLGSSSSR